VTFYAEHTCTKSLQGSDKTLTAKSIVLSNTIRVSLLFRVSHNSTVLYRVSSTGPYTEISVKIISYVGHLESKERFAIKIIC
jgi:hypothetical protein